jgi:serine/threonine protein kinase
MKSHQLITGLAHLTEQQISLMLQLDTPESLMDPTWLAHLDSCSSCQKQMAEMADDSWWKSTGRHMVPLNPTEDLKHSGLERPRGLADVAAPIPSSSGIDVSRHLQQHFDPVGKSDLLGRVEEYVIESVLGVGGMGVVFKGFDTELNRAVAVKFLSPLLVGQELARERFFREAKAAAAVCHENVVPIFRVSTCRGYPYFVMPLVSHDSLQSIVERDGPLPVIAAVQIGLQLAAGVAAAHEQGLIHRDIKPANVLLENGLNRALLSDFGLVYDLSSTPITQTGVLAGTPAYMSPEQAAGEMVVYHSDLFSLGSVLWFAVTGSAPFAGDNVIRVLDRIRYQPVKLQDARPDLPKPFVFIVEKLMSKSIADRYESATRLRQVLAEYLSHLQNPTQHALPTYLRPKSQRRVESWAFYAVSCAIILVLSYVFWNSLGEPDSERQSPSTVSSQEIHTPDAVPETMSPNFSVPPTLTPDSTPSKFLDTQAP